MGKFDKCKKNVNNFFFDHYYFSEFSKSMVYVILTALAGIIFAFGFVVFVTSTSTNGSYSFITGGLSGIAQDFVKIFETCGFTGLPLNTLHSIIYFSLNVPVLCFAFFKIGKRFAILSLINVGCATIFINIFPQIDGLLEISKNPILINSPLSRALFAGTITGFSSALAFIANSSSGGIDVISFYLGMKKSSTVGKYSVIINTFIATTYFILLVISNPSNWTDFLLTILYSIIYLIVAGLIIDLIHISNKKAMIQIISNKYDMGEILISLFPHSATITKGKGAYSGSDKYIIVMVVSTRESKRVVNTCKKIDPYSFISVTSLNQVYGKFFVKSVK